MKFRRILSLGVLALGLAVSGSACGIFESSEEEDKGPFYRSLDGSEKVNVKEPGPSGNANISGGGPGAEELLNAPGSSQEGPGLSNTYDNFGTPIPGVTFETVYFRFDQSRIESTRKHLTEMFGTSTQEIFADQRYGYIAGILHDATKETPPLEQLELIKRAGFEITDSSILLREGIKSN